MVNNKVDLYKTILLIIALLGVIYFVNDIFKKPASPISVVEIIEKENTVAIEESKEKIEKLKEQLIISQKREINLFRKFKLIQKNNEKINNKFDSTIFSNIELQRLFSNWVPEK